MRRGGGLLAVHGGTCYEEVPAMVAEKVIAESKKELGEEAEE